MYKCSVKINTPKEISPFYLFQAGLGVDGYICEIGKLCYQSSTGVQKYWSADLKTPNIVSTINYLGYSTQYANNTQVRAGLDPDIFNDPVVTTASYVDLGMSWRSVYLDPPILARYIGVTSANEILEICALRAYG